VQPEPEPKNFKVQAFSLFWAPSSSFFGKEKGFCPSSVFLRGCNPLKSPLLKGKSRLFLMKKPEQSSGLLNISLKSPAFFFFWKRERVQPHPVHLLLQRKGLFFQKKRALILFRQSSGLFNFMGSF